MTVLGLNLERADRFNPDYKLDLGAVAGRALSVFAANFVPFTLLACVLQAPVYALMWLLESQVEQGMTRTKADFLLQIASGFISLVLTGAVTYGVFEHLRGERPSMGAIVRTGVSRVLPVFGTALLVGLATGLATCALIIPGIIVACMLFVAMPVTVIERTAGISALDRSRELTTGNRWVVLGLMIVLTLLTTVPILAVTAGITLVQGQAPSRLTAALLGALLLPLAPLDGIVRVVCYHDLRVGREGAAVDDLVKVFD